MSSSLSQAVRIWCHPSKSLPSEILARWHRPECDFLSTARHKQCRFNAAQEQDFQLLKNALSLDHATRFLEAVSDSPVVTGDAENTWRPQQCLHLLQAMVHVVAAGTALDGWEHQRHLPDAFSKNIASALSVYESVWNLPSPPVPAESEFSGQHDLRSRQALSRFLKQQHSVVVSQIPFLMVQCLLAYVLGEENRQIGPTERTKLVLVDESSASEGRILPLEVCIHESGQQHFFLDPVALGLTLLDESLTQSLNLAWQAVLSDQAAWSLQPEQAICLSPRTDCIEGLPGLAEIDGESAGGVFACAIAAVARGDALDPNAAASVALELNVNPEGYDQLELKGVARDSFAGKLDAVDDPKSGIERFAFYDKQAGTPKPLLTRASARPVTHLGALYKVLTGNAAVERVLKRRAQKQQQAWVEERRLVESEHALLYYVPPHFAYKPQPDGQSADRDAAASAGRPVERHRARAERDDEAGPEAGNVQKRSPEFQRIEGKTEEDRLEFLLNLSDWLRIAEDPGVGKSVFTKRLEAFLSSDEGQRRMFEGRPPLVVLWEETDGAWPETDFISALETAVAECCEQESDCTRADVLKYALKHQRVVIILDAMEQVGNAARIEGILRRLREFLNGPGQGCRVVLTGRPLIMNANTPKLPHVASWQLAHIEEFDLQQQYRYLYGPSEDDLRELFGEDWANHVRIVTPQSPGDDDNDSRICVYRLVADIQQETDDRGGVLAQRVRRLKAKDLERILAQRFPHFEAVKDLQKTPQNLFLIRRLSQENGGRIPAFESRADIYLKTCQASIRRALSRLSAQEHLPADLEETTARLQAILAAIACEMMVRAPEDQSLKDSHAIAELRQAAGRRMESGVISDGDWRLLQQVTPITRRGIIREWETGELRWHHPRMMQFFCGLHLARNRQRDWDQNVRENHQIVKVGCGDDPVRRQAANPLWEEAFRFAMEIPTAVRDDSTLTASLSLLFEPPAGEFVRPSQLMWEAWQLFQPEDGGQPILKNGLNAIRRHFQAPYKEILHGHQGAKSQQRIAQAIEKGFVRCPPMAWWARFIRWLLPQDSPSEVTEYMMGVPQFKGGYKTAASAPPVKAQLSPFLIQAFPMTREQYALYDPKHDSTYQKEIEEFAPESRCPVCFVTWFDAWCCAMFMGKSLPTECQWEFACRAGTSTRFAFGEKLARKHANFNGQLTTPQGVYPPNAWDIYDMHGNVWEWCQDWYIRGLLTGGRDPVVNKTPNKRERIRRGGSFGFFAWPSRARNRKNPEDTNREMGFRLAAVPGCAKSSQRMDRDT